MELFELQIESLIFVSSEPLGLDDIVACLESYHKEKVERALVLESLDAIKSKYLQEDYAFELMEIADGYQFMTKGAYHPIVKTFLNQMNQKRLSRTALETLAIIAYKQPVSKPEIERIRGVNCDHTIQKLLEKELISIEGRGEGPGKPILYVTSEKFMNYFGLKSIDQLPTIKEFEGGFNEVGEEIPIERMITDLDAEIAPEH
ncbi:MAG: SMC-Scp complex subunit ScpB [Saprospiraceae bacterium]|nr:SMC-Scp complex subunit ScpB [Saprospiraceae bacterium]MBK6477048.1 SMC-Scp complex subunit ScpB [Saprospiraceae bacterium]MBK6814654.1 SMC-Scp complex subunit ScpB [Saprospiraceae bacterium]MBK7370040.1 SMC-Scp complex subunit ScpB [Saprospiraceae bacterium]MBK7437745.1 SMC-Scp complex subunit ScpB [Saprospiraceae bacterium]